MHKYLRYLIFLGFFGCLGGQSEASWPDLKDSEYYSWEKQPYNPSHFQQRVKSFVEQKGRKENLKSYSGVVLSEKWSGLYFPDFKEVSYSTKPLEDAYKEEKILYLKQKKLEEKQLFWIQDHFHKFDGTLYSSKSPINQTEGTGEMIVMDAVGNIFIHPKHRNLIHHSSFFSGEPVAFAGLCYIEEGQLKKYIPYSGHYVPGLKEIENFKAFLGKKIGADPGLENSLKI